MTTLLPILFEDEFLVAVDKPCGLPSHWTPRFEEHNLHTLAETQLGVPLVLLHRLDQDTSGIILLSKEKITTQKMATLFLKHRIRKAYWAVVDGDWRPEWNRVETYISRKDALRFENVAEGTCDDARHALTTFRLLAANGEKSLIEALPKTGRTHQIRLHSLYQGRPILGDWLYNPKVSSSGGMALHAKTLDFRHPKNNEEIHLAAPLPSRWQDEWLVGLAVDCA